MTTGKDIELDCTPYQSIYETKTKLADVLSSNVDDLQIIFRAVPVDNSKCFKDLDITSGPALFFVSISNTHKQVEKPHKSASSRSNQKNDRKYQYLPPREPFYQPREEKVQNMIAILQELGFEKEMCAEALKAASYNCDRAAEYLLANSIPCDVCQDVDTLCEQRNKVCQEAVEQNVGDYSAKLEQLSPDQREAIKRLEANGFEKHLVIQVYYACEFNEENALNILSNMDTQ
ncbi:UBA/TS-N domain containing protein [Trichomonas vaginalis G3]|uniref:UV excision repair protein RAD23 n=1 Tax=Trichomonas vaginalis (strain ATCC PRA-98 / G3) TaxID=412133 RepID=A2DH54_TRIV3|nr:UV excision repair protein RAD23 family [Trichomonas vaginalis G3]EAY20364.1 UBA/TS-N domain containing protein [Trichomonas vaginalis G3]KAI5530636.1 UV excision repair protein RAD23 family [Trichomonas vaginalis G3]|eukprot:XP_001581350.1 UBA/TS-N domain containing protein [Trichomonas vaginalis G3]